MGEDRYKFAVGDEVYYVDPRSQDCRILKDKIDKRVQECILDENMKEVRFYGLYYGGITICEDQLATSVTELKEMIKQQQEKLLNDNIMAPSMAEKAYKEQCEALQGKLFVPTDLQGARILRDSDPATQIYVSKTLTNIKMVGFDLLDSIDSSKQDLECKRKQEKDKGNEMVLAKTINRLNDLQHNLLAVMDQI